MESAATPHKSELRKTPLNALHRRLGAKMVNFDGWDMPVEYPSSGGLIAEHKAVRGSVGVFDVSHMGDIRIHSGANSGGALAAVQHVSMNDASKLAIGQAHYSAMLYPEGTFVDDVIVHRLGDVDLSGIKNYWFTHGTVCSLKNTLIARTGYTGEDGFEVYVPSDVATSETVWNQVVEAGREFAAVPCGLGCRNTLRLESKMALYGHEISDRINVWEAGLDRYCKMEKGSFVGRAALEQVKAAGLRRTLIGIEMVERGIARDQYCCCNEAGDAIGVVTSGSPSPTLGKNIALAYVPPEYSAVGTVLYVEIRGQKCKAQVVPTPFYKRPKKAAAPRES